MLDKQENHLKEYVLSFFTEQMKQIRLHDKMSPETAARIASIEEWRLRQEILMADIAKKQDRIIIALFGDKETDEMGIVKEHKLLYDKLVGFNGIKGLFQFILLSGGVAGILGVVYSVFKK